jgi:hypothetical protein
MYPAHLAHEHVGLLKHKFVGRTRGLPLFPAEMGKVVAKEAAVKSYEQVAVHCVEPLRNDMARRRLTGHSTRLSGGKYLARIVVSSELGSYTALADFDWSGTVQARCTYTMGLASHPTIRRGSVHEVTTADCRRLLAGEGLHLAPLVSPLLARQVPPRCCPSSRPSSGLLAEGGGQPSRCAEPHGSREALLSTYSMRQHVLFTGAVSSR